MPVSLFDVTIGSFLQGLGGAAVTLRRGAEHFSAPGEADAVVQESFWPDMKPMQFQIQSVAHHSLGAIEGVRRGEFSPPPPLAPQDYAGLQAIVAEAEAALRAVTPQEVESFIGKEVWFRAGERQLPFTAENFLMSFSLPNFYFHAATAYDILRSKGVPLGKRDYMGRLRMKA
jgi:hypothetical protein